MEDNPVAAFITKLQGFRQMPGNGLAFAVFIGCEDDAVAFFNGLFEIFESCLVFNPNPLVWLKIVFYVNPKFTPGQIADMAVRRFH